MIIVVVDQDQVKPQPLQVTRVKELQAHYSYGILTIRLDFREWHLSHVVFQSILEVVFPPSYVFP